MAVVADIIGIALVAAGLTLATIALWGLLHMDRISTQLHAAGLISGPSVIAVLLAAPFTGEASIITSAVLVLIFVLISAPLASHAIAHAARRGVERVEPEVGRSDSDR
jgi:multicomponent Na+:H+ antiporter subunit G